MMPFILSPLSDRGEGQLRKKCMKIPYVLKDLTLYIPEKNDRKSVFGLQHTLKYKWAYYTATNNFQQPPHVASMHLLQP